MPEKTLADMSGKMREIDFCMLTTTTQGGGKASRPMSNNGQVEYEGDSWFFSYDDARTISDIKRNDAVGLTFTGAPGEGGKPPLFIAIEANAELIRDKDTFREHWTDGLERWFPDGVETEGLILIKARATRLHYWDGEQEGDIEI